MHKSFEIYTYSADFITESGEILHRPTLSYTTYGTINGDGSNVVWVCHALTADSDVFSWWEGLFGPSDIFNPSDYFIICVNNPGSCYGSIGPLSINPKTEKIYGHDFPYITVRDVAKLFDLLRAHLKIKKIHVLIGGSQGGHIAQELIITANFEVEQLILIATSAQHSAWGIAFNETQRLCIETDHTWKTDDIYAGKEGMKAARALALLSYRNYHSYRQFQSGTNENGTPKSITYQRYQGEKLAARFNAYSYYVLSKLMDSHDIGRERGLAENILKGIWSKTLVVSVSSDILFPPEEQEFLAKNITNAELVSIDSIYGHDGFLTETEKLSVIISQFLNIPDKKNISENITIYTENDTTPY